MKTSYTTSLLLVFALFFQLLQGQVTAVLTLANEQVDNGSYLFDIYVSTASGSAGDLYLGNADFRLYFSTAAFSNPALSLESGFCTLVPTLPGAGNINNLITQATYSNNTATSISSGELVINLNGPTPGSTSAFESSVAKIDGTLSTHRIGRFKISGYQSGSPGLSWKTSGALRTLVYTLSTDAIGPPPFASSVITLQQAALPVTLLSFAANPVENTMVKLNWSTGTEVNHDHFVIEKKRGDADFEEIARVSGKGSHGAEYEFLDQSPMSEWNYYRLRQVDTDGAFVYSRIAEVRMAPSHRASIFPNPFKDQLTIQMSVEQTGSLKFVMVDATGRVVLTSPITPHQNQVFTGHLAPGTYFYRIHTGMEVISGKLIK